ncbi:chemotaxis protein CheW [Neobacillus sp. SM06]|uniref:chemotaxis protein CheW n=1 Tax=Neobacillus sp. SM06 TaxID=3422492 RepID=UPI003D270460
MNKYVIFKTGNEEYGIPLQEVVSIEKLTEMTPIPQMPDYVKGMIEIREELFPIIDLEYIFYNRYQTLNEDARFVVVQTDELSLAILVNEVKEIIEIAPEKMKQVPLLANDKTTYLSGVTSLESGLVTLINPQRLVGSLDGINELQDYLESHQ